MRARPLGRTAALGVVGMVLWLQALPRAATAATATATVKDTVVEVGEPVAVTVRVTARPNATVTLRPPPPNVPAYTVEAGGARMVQADASGLAELTFHVVPWVDGETQVAPAAVEIHGQGQVGANAVTVRARNPLGPDAAKAAPKDIRDIRPFPPRAHTAAWMIPAALAAAVAGWFLARALSRKDSLPIAPVPAAPARGPDRSLGDWIDAVQRIARNPPSDARGMREAHFVIAEAVRRFVEERWEIPASRQTTEEFLREVSRSHRFRGGGMSILPVVLEACDRVKWADDRVAPQDTLEVAKLALDFFAASRAAYRGLGEEPLQPGPGGVR